MGILQSANYTSRNWSWVFILSHPSIIDYRQPWGGYGRTNIEVFFSSPFGQAGKPAQGCRCLLSAAKYTYIVEGWVPSAGKRIGRDLGEAPVVFRTGAHHKDVARASVKQIHSAPPHKGAPRKKEKDKHLKKYLSETTS
jgi:hypothetical protein